jgi:hypothetical protein
MLVCLQRVARAFEPQSFAASLGVHELALRHTQVMGLVMRSAHHDADEAQSAKAFRLLWVARCDGQHNTIRQWLGLGTPAIKMAVFNLLSVRRDHALYGFGGSPRASDYHYNAVIYRF